jgi:hypothetical protein
MPELRPIGGTQHLSRCHFAEELEGYDPMRMQERAAGGVG